MIVRRIIFALFLGILTAQSARAETACGTLSQMIESVSLVRQIQTDPGGPTYGEQIERLGEVAAQISLPDLIPLDPNATRASERDALIRYVSGLREAVAGAASGHDGYAQQALGTIVTPEVFSGLSSMETHWDCGGEETARDTQSESERGSDQTAFSGSGGGDAGSSTSQPSNPAQSSSSSRNNPTTDGSGGGSYFGRDAIVGGNMISVGLMLMIVALVGGFFIAQKLLHRKSVRETRRALNILVQVQISGQTHNMRLVDISMNGFKLGHSGQLEGQDEINVELGHDWHIGQIRWANPHYAGVKFKRPIDEGTLSDITTIPDSAEMLRAAE